MISIVKPQPERMRLKGDFNGLIRLIKKTKDPDVKKEAILALGRMQTPSAVPELISLFSDTDASIRETASKALIYIGKDAIPVFIEEYSNVDDQTAKMIHLTLIDIGDESAQVIIKNISHLNGIGYERAAYTIYSMGNRIIPLLIDSLSTPDKKTREFAESLLQIFGRSTINILIQALYHEDEETKARVASFLILLGDQIIPDLLISSAQDDEFQYNLKLFIISEIGDEAFKSLTVALTDPNLLLSAMARRSILKYGDSAIKHLINGVFNPNPDIAGIYQKAVLEIGPDIVPSLINELSSRSDTECETISVLLVKLGEPAIPYLVSVLSAQKGEAKRRISSVIISNGSKSIPYLLASIDEPDNADNIRDIFLSMGKVAFPFLEEATNQEDEIRAVFSVNLIREIDSIRSIDPLITALSHKNKKVRMAALDNLTELREAAIPRLINTLYSEDKEAVSMAILAIEKNKDIAVFYLVSSLGDRIGDDHSIVKDLIRKIGSPALPYLIDEMANGKKGSESAVELVKEYGPKGTEYLIDAMKDAPSDLINPIKKMLIFLFNNDPKEFIDNLVSVEHLNPENLTDFLKAFSDQIIPLLIEVLLGSDSDRSLTAGSLLSIIGKPAVTPLIKALREEGEDDKKLVITTFLIKTGSDGVPELIESLNDPDIAPYAVAALGAIGEPAVHDLIMKLSSGNEPVVEYASITLARIGKPAVPYIIDLMQKDPSMSTVVSRIMGDMKVVTLPDMVKELSILNQQGLGDSERGRVLLSKIIDTVLSNNDDLGYLFTISDGGVVELLEKEFVGRGETILNPLLDAVIKEPMIPDLAAHIFTTMRPQTLNAIKTRMEEIPQGDPMNIPFLHLSGLLKDPGSLSLMGKAMHDEDNKVRFAAVQELGKLGNEAAIPLSEALHDKDPEVKAEAVASLGQIGLPALDKLLNALKDPDPLVRSNAIKGIAKIGEPGQFMLIQSLNDSDRSVRRTVANLLEQSHYNPKYTTDRISYLFAKENFDALVSIGPPSLDILIKGLHDKDSEINIKSKDALAAIRKSLK